MNVCDENDGGSQLQQKFVTVNKVIKAAVVCDGCDTSAYACDLAPTEMCGPTA
jgi:hypothetical protein